MRSAPDVFAGFITGQGADHAPTYGGLVERLSRFRGVRGDRRTGAGLPGALRSLWRFLSAAIPLRRRSFDIPREGMAGGLMLRFAVLNELRERAGGVPVDNTGVTYAGFADDAALAKLRAWVVDGRHPGQPD